MNREGGGLVGNSGGGGPPPPGKPEEKKPNRVEEMSKRGTESLVRETKPPINRMSKDPEKLGSSSSLPPREQKLVAAIGPPPVAQVAPIPRVLQVFHVFLTHFPQRGLNLKSCVLPISLQEPLKHL